MKSVLYFFALTVKGLLGVEDLAMLFRAILSWFIPEEDSPVCSFLVAVTEPFIAPFRFLLGRFRFVEECPFDIAFMAAFFALMLLEELLPALS
ncbi:MAG: YggT family protein [Clostridia bacterium]|nr:YggT family protein [Clostridia bacterium]